MWSLFLQTEGISSLKLNKNNQPPMDCHRRFFLFIRLYQHQQPQPQLFPQSQPLPPHPQPEKRITTRRIRIITNQPLFPPKHELHILKQLLRKMYMNRFLRFIVYNMPAKKKCYRYEAVLLYRHIPH